MIKKHHKLASALGSDGLEGYTAKVPLDQKFYFQYFVQDEIEDGTLMDTKVPVKEVSTLEITFFTSVLIYLLSGVCIYSLEHLKDFC